MHACEMYGGRYQKFSPPDPKYSVVPYSPPSRGALRHRLWGSYGGLRGLLEALQRLGAAYSGLKAWRIKLLVWSSDFSTYFVHLQEIHAYKVDYGRCTP